MSSLDHAVSRMLSRIDATLAQPGEGFPHYANPETGIWVRSPKGDWTGGFWVGQLWLAAKATGERRYLEAARDWVERLRPRVASQTVFKGFLFWYGAGIGRELLGDPVAADVAKAGSDSLIAMYNPTARLIPLGVEAEEASDVGSDEANIDALPGTLALLLTSGDTEARAIADNHMRQHLKLCVRGDGSVCQSATFDPSSGALVRRYTHKGYSEDSTWGRAQAWAMVALAQAIARGESGAVRDAVRIADWWLAHAPADGVAFWDFDDPAIPNTNRDTSATAIATASLMKLAALVPERREAYGAAAEKSLHALVERHLTPTSADDRRPHGIVTDGCFNKRNGVGTTHELIWGDYFLLESLLAATGLFPAEAI